MSRCRFSRIEQDLLLVEEVQTQNPFASEDPKSAWEKVCTNLNALKLFGAGVLDERAVKAHTTKLILLYRKKETRNGRKSGTEEQFGKLDEILADIESAERSCVADKTKNKKGNVQAPVNDQINVVIEEAGEVGKG